MTGDARWDQAVEEHVLLQVKSLAKQPAVAAGLATGRVRLHAWVLRFEASEVLAYDAANKEFTPLLEMPVVHPIEPRGEKQAEPVKAAPTKVEPLVTPKLGLLETLKYDLPASFVVFAVALPLCVAIAKASGVSTAAGIITAVFGGIVVGLLGGGPLQVSGPTAGLIMVLLGIIDQRGVGGSRIDCRAGRPDANYRWLLTLRTLVSGCVSCDNPGHARRHWAHPLLAAIARHGGRCAFTIAV